MATVIDSVFDPNSNSRYPWHQWLDGQCWELTEGVDFTTAPESFRSGAVNRARNQGQKLRTRIVSGETGTRVVIQAFARN